MDAFVLEGTVKHSVRCEIVVRISEYFPKFVLRSLFKKGKMGTIISRIVPGITITTLSIYFIIHDFLYYHRRKYDFELSFGKSLFQNIFESKGNLKSPRISAIFRNFRRILLIFYRGKETCQCDEITSNFIFQFAFE